MAHSKQLNIIMLLMREQHRQINKSFKIYSVNKLQLDSGLLCSLVHVRVRNNRTEEERYFCCISTHRTYRHNTMYYSNSAPDFIKHVLQGCCFELIFAKVIIGIPVITYAL